MQNLFSAKVFVFTNRFLRVSFLSCDMHFIESN